MPSKPLPISPAVAQLLRDRRQSLGLTLRRVEELSAESGDPIPHSTLARIELGKFDPGVRRLGQLLGLYQLPIQAAGDVLDLEALSGPTPIERDPVKLRDRALEAWRLGRIPEALACFLSFRRRVPNDHAHRVMRHDSILAFAIAAASLGRAHLSRHMLDELLMEKPEPPVLVKILIQQSVVWRCLGSPVAALAFVDSAAKYARRDAPKVQGWIQHQRAQVLIDQREFAAAAKCLSLAVQFHRRAKSPHDQALALLSMARLRFEEGKADPALVAARSAEQFAAKQKFNRIRLSALLEQARALAAMKSFDAGKKLLRTVLADSLAADDNALCFYAHFYLWQAERDSGNIGRAAIEIREAGYYLKYVDQNSPEASVLRQEIAGVRNDDGSSASPRKRQSRKHSGVADVVRFSPRTRKPRA
jgi:transcriptional regulator with XRE-family HTH domain